MQELIKQTKLKITLNSIQTSDYQKIIQEIEPEKELLHQNIIVTFNSIQTKEIELINLIKRLGFLLYTQVNQITLQFCLWFTFYCCKYKQNYINRLFILIDKGMSPKIKVYFLRIIDQCLNTLQYIILFYKKDNNCILTSKKL
ncbi:unnamed protein product [Paramecium pentaurelia]|uniref:Uncharacterized protein n=1 Tax=Paramecium pentaurelia TaxID=43138 RepID=A0A8S1SWQ3_9CILI|nr:unnamed protein product [Paramecium pentaurelia]